MLTFYEKSRYIFLFLSLLFSLFCFLFSFLHFRNSVDILKQILLKYLRNWKWRLISWRDIYETRWSLWTFRNCWKPNDNLQSLGSIFFSCIYFVLSLPTWEQWHLFSMKINKEHGNLPFCHQNTKKLELKSKKINRISMLKIKCMKIHFLFIRTSLMSTDQKLHQQFTKSFYRWS